MTISYLQQQWLGLGGDFHVCNIWTLLEKSPQEENLKFQFRHGHGYVGDLDRDLIVIVMYLKDADKEDSTRVADRPPVDHHKQRFQPGEVFGHLEIRWSPFKWGSHQPWSAATTGAGASLRVSILLGRRQSAPACQRQGSDGDKVFEMMIWRDH